MHPKEEAKRGICKFFEESIFIQVLGLLAARMMADMRPSRLAAFSFSFLFPRCLSHYVNISWLTDCQGLRSGTKHIAERIFVLHDRIPAVAANVG